MWHYVEGITNWDPVWPQHGIRILPGPSSLWLDATGRRLPVPLFPGFDTLGTLEHLRRTGHDHSWFVTSRQIVEKEFALSGSEQNPDLTGKDVALLLKSRLAKGRPDPCSRSSTRARTSSSRTTSSRCWSRWRPTPGASSVDIDAVRREVVARDREMVNDFSKDPQIGMLRSMRAYRGDKLIRTAAPHRLQDPSAGPLIAVKLHVLTRKSLGGINTDLDGRALDGSGAPIPGLFAAGEASGFGGGGAHGYRALEGTFLGGCLFSGRQATRSGCARLSTSSPPGL
ncbi:hypothetical protein CTI14_33865 [Methylobacterium radiotolerans]|nr:hypothetical protein CTI14_33865 [Methylobacterium radiotolerans]